MVRKLTVNIVHTLYYILLFTTSSATENPLMKQMWCIWMTFLILLVRDIFLLRVLPDPCGGVWMCRSSKSVAHLLIIVSTLYFLPNKTAGVVTAELYFYLFFKLKLSIITVYGLRSGGVRKGLTSTFEKVSLCCGSVTWRSADIWSVQPLCRWIKQ